MNKTLLHKIATQRREVRIQSALRKIAADVIDMEWNPQAGYWQAGTGATSAADIQPGARAAAGSPAGFNFFGGYGGSMIADAIGLGRGIGSGIDRAFGIENSAPIFTGAGQFADSVGGWALGQRYLTKQNLGRALGTGWKAVRHPIQTGKAVATGARMVGRGMRNGYRAAAPVVKPALRTAGTAIKAGGSKFLRYASKALPYILKGLKHVR